MKKKRLFLILAVIAILAAGFFLAAFLVSKRSGMSTGEVIGSLFPFGTPEGSVAVPGGRATTTTEAQTGEEFEPFNPLVQLSQVPTAGRMFFERGGKTFVDFVERATGHITEVSLEDLSREEISKTTLPGIYEALWMEGGKTVLYRYLRDNQDTIVSFALPAPRPLNATSTSATTTLSTAANTTATSTNPSASTGTAPYKKDEILGGVFLPDGIWDAIVSHDGKGVFYTTINNSPRKLFGYAGTSGGTIKKVFEHEFLEWLPVAFNSQRVWLQSRAAGGIPGYLFVFNTAAQSFTKVIGGVQGLTALPSPDGKKILYSESAAENGDLRTFIYNTEKKASREFPVLLLPEKCVWTRASDALYCAVPVGLPPARYPDDWYKGKVSFTDNIWKIGVSSFATEANIALNMVSLGKEIDATNLALSADEYRLIFINKKDSTLWLYRQY